MMWSTEHENRQSSSCWCHDVPASDQNSVILLDWNDIIDALYLRDHSQSRSL